MDNRLKEAIAAARTGDKVTAQRQLTELLADDPEQEQGWYLLSLLVDSPQKQAAYLSKTLALNPNHEKAKEQLDALQAAGELAPTATITAEASQPLDVLAQSETDQPPDWLREASGETTTTAVPATAAKEMAVAEEDLPDWLIEPAAPTDMQPSANAIDELPTIVGKSAEPAAKPDETVADRKTTSLTTPQKRPKAARTTKQNTRNLNIILGILVILAVIVIILLAYLLLS